MLMRSLLTFPVEFPIYRYGDRLKSQKGAYRVLPLAGKRTDRIDGYDNSLEEPIARYRLEITMCVLTVKTKSQAYFL